MHRRCCILGKIPRPLCLGKRTNQQQSRQTIRDNCLSNSLLCGLVYYSEKFHHDAETHFVSCFANETKSVKIGWYMKCSPDLTSFLPIAYTVFSLTIVSVISLLCGLVYYLDKFHHDNVSYFAREVKSVKVGCCIMCPSDLTKFLLCVHPFQIFVKVLASPVKQFMTIVSATVSCAV